MAEDGFRSMEAVERDRAIEYILRALRAEQEANADFPRLSEPAMRDVAERVVSENGYGNYQRNDQDALMMVLNDPDRWEYYGTAGRVRRFFKRMFIKTEEVTEWRRNRSTR
jgi:hypothetical protein